VQGDLEPDMVMTVTAQGALAALATALSVQLRWKKPDGTTSMVTLTVVDVVNGIVKRVWQTGDTNITGLHRGQIVVTASNGETATSPADGTDILWMVYAAV
jgi:hypothetical protein